MPAIDWQHVASNGIRGTDYKHSKRGGEGQSARGGGGPLPASMLDALTEGPKPPGVAK